LLEIYIRRATWQSIPSKYKDLFDKQIFAGLVTLMPDGSPQVTPVWIDFDGEYVLFNTAAGRQKDIKLQRDGPAWRWCWSIPTTVPLIWKFAVKSRTDPEGR